jgi:hypothetical protein
MGAVLVVAAIIGIFFAVGLIVGGITVIALPVLRERRSQRRDRREPGDNVVQAEYGPTVPDGTGPDEAAPDDRPGWPGDRPERTDQ